MDRFKTVDAFVEAQGKWKEAIVKLRELALESGMEETVKWGGPCYTINGKNVLGLGAFKSYVGIWFHQGALLSDPYKVLINAQEGTTKALRQWRFNNIDEIDETGIKTYVAEAIENQKQGIVIKADRNKQLSLPPELMHALVNNPQAKACFDELTKGKQREYAEYIAEAKREDTKQKRLEKVLPMILVKRGLNDKYRR